MHVVSSRRHRVVGERLEGVQAAYRSTKGDAFKVQFDFHSFDMLHVYRHLTETVRHPATQHPEDVAEGFAVLDAIASKSALQKRRLEAWLAIAALTNVYWLEHHGHLVSDEHNGMAFIFSRPCPTEPGRRVGFTRQTLDPTPGQETAFARALLGASNRTISKFEEDPE